VSLPEIQGVDRAVPVLLQGSLLGAVTVTKAQGDPLRHTEEVLLDDLAGQAGLVLANARLTAELQARLNELTERSAELQRSRQRIVTAQDEERRRLERNIHDGAQQHLVALAVKLRLVRSLISRDPVKAGAMLSELRGEVDDALETLSNLALGIYPPLLEEQGLATALAAQYQRMDLTVQLHANGVSRYPIELEAAVYFCALEALQNIAKYANASIVDITLGERDGDLTFEVTDDGKGFDAATAPRGSGLNNMQDRLSVLGGGVTVTSSEGRGTSVRGRVPLESERTIAGIS
jgi:signal transduction histidine kinase